MLRTGKIYGINGPVVYLKGNTGFKMSEMVYVGKERLVGEVIALDKERTTIQVFEETTGLRPGETVEASGDAISVTLAPGILNNIFDGIERPLERIAENSGAYISRGVSVDSLDKTKKWSTHMTVSVGDEVHGGHIIAEVPETAAIVHKCMVPPNISGMITKVVPDGEYTIDEPLVPNREGRNSLCAWWIWYWKDNDTASDRKMVGCRHYHLYWMWRAWKRDDTGIGRVYSACGSKIRKSVDGSNNIDRQYIQHAGGCP